MSCSSRMSHTSGSAGIPVPLCCSQDTALTSCGCPQLWGALRLHSPKGLRYLNLRERQEPRQVFWPCCSVLVPAKLIIPIELPSLCRRLGKWQWDSSDCGSETAGNTEKKELAAYKVSPAVGHTHPDPQLWQLSGKGSECIFRIWGSHQPPCVEGPGYPAQKVVLGECWRF